MSALEADVALARGSLRLEASIVAREGITIVFGPSGAGKTTLLHAILGALRPERGRVALGGRVLFDAASGTDAPVRSRRIGIVFQDALLFPHMTALGNVAFAARGSASDGTRAAGAWLEKVGGDSLASRRPADLSGGERQRIALARALAARPEALLLDEPFSSLDAGSRAALGTLLVGLQSALGIPFVHVTHDAGEALRLGTHLVVLDGGRVIQEGVPADVVASPSSAAAARVMGTENLFAGTVLADRPDDGFSEVDLGGTAVDTPLLRLARGSRVVLGLRAEDVIVATAPVAGTSARNVIAGTIERVIPGDDAVELRIATPVKFRVRVTPAAARELDLVPGRSVHLLIKANAFHRLDR